MLYLTMYKLIAGNLSNNCIIISLKEREERKCYLEDKTFIRHNYLRLENYAISHFEKLRNIAIKTTSAKFRF